MHHCMSIKGPALLQEAEVKSYPFQKVFVLLAFQQHAFVLLTALSQLLCHLYSTPYRLDFVPKPLLLALAHLTVCLQALQLEEG